MTIGNLLSQDDQVRCFENAARHLADDGMFVLECQVPTAPSRPGHRFVDPEIIGVDHVVFDVCRYDPVWQILDENHVRISSDGVVFGPIRVRLAHPPEFDLMARIAGLRLREPLGRLGPRTLHSDQLAPHQRLQASEHMTSPYACLGVP